MLCAGAILIILTRRMLAKERRDLQSAISEPLRLRPMGFAAELARDKAQAA